MKKVCFRLRVGFLFAVLALSVFTPCFAEEKGGILEAYSALPAKYQDGVLNVSADNGDPSPDTWYLLVRNSARKGAVHSVSVQKGRVVRDEPSLNLRAVLGAHTPIDFSKVRTDIGEIWEAVNRYAEKKGKKAGSVCYVLTQSGAASDPVWQVWVYDPRGYSAGFLKMLATTGGVIESD